MKATFSRADLLLECQWWASADVRGVGGSSNREAARFGTCVHEILAGSPSLTNINAPKTLAKKYDDVDVPLAAQTAVRAAEALQRWLRQVDDDVVVGKAMRELPLAYNVEADTARVIAAVREEDHVYEDAATEELPGTIDLLLLPPKRDGVAVILDYKTGHDTYRPDSMAQLWCGALAAQRVYGFSRFILAVLHATAEGVPNVYATHEQSGENLEAFRKRLLRAWRGIGSGALRPGPHCESLYCAAYESCPRHGNTLAKLGAIRGLETIGTPEEIGAAYERLREYDALASAVRDWVRRSIRLGKQPGILSSGVLELQLRERRNLSQASVIRALGETAGKRMLKMLDEKGCIETSSYEQLQVVKEKG